MEIEPWKRCSASCQDWCFWIAKNFGRSKNDDRWKIRFANSAGHMQNSFEQMYLLDQQQQTFRFAGGLGRKRCSGKWNWAPCNGTCIEAKHRHASSGVNKSHAEMKCSGNHLVRGINILIFVWVTVWMVYPLTVKRT